MRDWVPLVVAVCALAAGVFAGIASIRATKTNQEANQIKWLADAREQSAKVQRDMDKVQEDLATTRRDLVQTKRQITEQSDLIEETTRWCIRVIDWAHDDTMSHAELRRLINGGPATLRAELHRNQDGGRGRNAGGAARQEGRRRDERRD